MKEQKTITSDDFIASVDKNTDNITGNIVQH